MQFCAKLGKIIEKTIKRCHKIQFFSWSSIKFFLNVHNFRVRELCEIRSFGYVFSYQFIGVFNAPFLPRRVRVRKIHLYIFLHFHIQSFGYQLMCGEFTAIVRGDGFDGSAIGKKLLYHSLAIGSAFLPVGMRCISSILVLRSANVNITCCWLSTIKSISQSPKRLPLASLGQS